MGAYMLRTSHRVTSSVHFFGWLREVTEVELPNVTRTRQYEHREDKSGLLPCGQVETPTGDNEKREVISHAQADTVTPRPWSACLVGNTNLVSQAMGEAIPIQSPSAGREG